jgi:two-component system, OmpR family, sensor histidine kinase PrrB
MTRDGCEVPVGVWQQMPSRLRHRLFRRLTPVVSLRTIVIVAALSVVGVVIFLGTWVWVGITNNQYGQLDRQLDSVSALGDVGRLGRVPNADTDEPLPDGMVRTVRISGATLSKPRDITLPDLPNGYTTATVNGVQYRVHTFSAGRASIAIGAPITDARQAIRQLHLRVLLICGGFIVGTFIVGSLMWSVMINPFRLLAQHARAINAQSNPEEVQVHGVWEAVEIAEAVEGMLARIGTEQQRTKAALESARDFAAVASHELRTPLTAMRTNLEVLHTLDLDADQRKELTEDIIRTQSRIEATLAALERLAQGELSTVDDHVPLDITELLDRAAHDARRIYPDLDVTLLPSPTVLMLGLPTGLRLVIDNAIANAVKHGQATQVQLSAISSRAGVEIVVDDNGTGIPEDERTAMFERFTRGSKASHSGSGLGLALVAQQAELHGGTAFLEDSPLGGTRLLLRLPGPGQV